MFCQIPPRPSRRLFGKGGLTQPALRRSAVNSGTIWQTITIRRLGPPPLLRRWRIIAAREKRILRRGKPRKVRNARNGCPSRVLLFALRRNHRSRKKRKLRRREANHLPPPYSSSDSREEADRQRQKLAKKMISPVGKRCEFSHFGPMQFPSAAKLFPEAGF